MDIAFDQNANTPNASFSDDDSFVSCRDDDDSSSEYHSLHFDWSFDPLDGEQSTIRAVNPVHDESKPEETILPKSETTESEAQGSNELDSDLEDIHLPTSKERVLPQTETTESEFQRSDELDSDHKDIHLPTSEERVLPQTETTESEFQRSDELDSDHKDIHLPTSKETVLPQTETTESEFQRFDELDCDHKDIHLPTSEERVLPQTETTESEFQRSDELDSDHKDIHLPTSEERVLPQTETTESEFQRSDELDSDHKDIHPPTSKERFLPQSETTESEFQRSDELDSDHKDIHLPTSEERVLPQTETTESEFQRSDELDSDHKDIHLPTSEERVLPQTETTESEFQRSDELDSDHKDIHLPTSEKRVLPQTETTESDFQRSDELDSDHKDIHLLTSKETVLPQSETTESEFQRSDELDSDHKDIHLPTSEERVLPQTETTESDFQRSDELDSDHKDIHLLTSKETVLPQSETTESEFQRSDELDCDHKDIHLPTSEERVLPQTETTESEFQRSDELDCDHKDIHLPTSEERVLPQTETTESEFELDSDHEVIHLPTSEERVLPQTDMSESTVERSNELDSDQEAMHLPTSEEVLPQTETTESEFELDSDHKDILLTKPEASKIETGRFRQLDPTPENSLPLQFDEGYAEDGRPGEVLIMPEETPKPDAEIAEDDRCDELLSPAGKLNESTSKAGSIRPVVFSSLVQPDDRPTSHEAEVTSANAGTASLPPPLASMAMPTAEATSASAPTEVSSSTPASVPKALSPLKPITTMPSMMVMPTPMKPTVATPASSLATKMPAIKPPLLMMANTPPGLTTPASAPATTLKQTATTRTITTAAAALVTTTTSPINPATTQSTAQPSTTAMVPVPTPMKTAKMMVPICICELLKQVLHEGCRVLRELELVKPEERINLHAMHELRTRESLNALHAHYGTSFDYECPVHGVTPLKVQYSFCCFCALPVSGFQSSVGGTSVGLGGVGGATVGLGGASVGLGGASVAVGGLGGASLESVYGVGGSGYAGGTNLGSYVNGGLGLDLGLGPDMATFQGFSNVGGANVSLGNTGTANLSPANASGVAFGSNVLLGANLFSGQAASASFGWAGDVRGTKPGSGSSASRDGGGASNRVGGATASGGSASMVSSDASVALSGLSDEEREVCNSATTKLVKMRACIEEAAQKMNEHIQRLETKVHKMEASRQEVEAELRNHVTHLYNQIEQQLQWQTHQLRQKHPEIMAQVIATCTQVKSYKSDLAKILTEVEDKLNRIHRRHDVNAANDDDVTALNRILQTFISTVTLPEVETISYRVDIPWVTSDDIQNLLCRVRVDNSSRSSTQQKAASLSASQTVYPDQPEQIYPGETRQDKSSQVNPGTTGEDEGRQTYLGMMRQGNSAEIFPDAALQDSTSPMYSGTMRQVNKPQMYSNTTRQGEGSQTYPGTSRRENPSDLHPDVPRPDIPQSYQTEPSEATPPSSPASSANPASACLRPLNDSQSSEYQQEVSDQHGFSPMRWPKSRTTPGSPPTPSPSPSSSSPPAQAPSTPVYWPTPTWGDGSYASSLTPPESPYRDPYAHLYGDTREYSETLDDVYYTSEAEFAALSPEASQDSYVSSARPSASESPFGDSSQQQYCSTKEWLEQLQLQQQERENQQKYQQHSKQEKQNQHHQQQQDQHRQQQQQQQQQPPMASSSAKDFSWADLASGRCSSHDGAKTRQPQPRSSSPVSSKDKRPETTASSTRPSTGQHHKQTSGALPTDPTRANLASGCRKIQDENPPWERQQPPSTSSSLATKEKHSDTMASNQSISSCTEQPVTFNRAPSWAQVASGAKKDAAQLNRQFSTSTSCLAKKDRRAETMASNTSIASCSRATTSSKKKKTAAARNDTDFINGDSAATAEPHPQIPVKITIPSNPAPPKMIKLRGEGKAPKGLAPAYNGHLWVVYGHEDPHLDVVDEDGKEIMSERIGGNAMDIACYSPERVLVSCISPRCLKLLNSKLKTTWTKELLFTQRGIGVGVTGIALATSNALYWLDMDGGNSQWIVQPPSNDKPNGSATSAATKIGRLCSCDVVNVQGFREIVCVADVEACKVRLYEKKRLNDSSGGSSKKKTTGPGFSPLVAFSCTIRHPGKSSSTHLVPVSVSAHPSGFLGVLDEASMSVVIVDIAGQEAKAVSIISREHLCKGIPSVIAFAIHGSDSRQDPKLWVGTSSGQVCLVPLRFVY